MGVKLEEGGGEFGGVRENSGRTLGEFGWGRVDSSSWWEIRKDVVRILQGGDGKNRWVTDQIQRENWEVKSEIVCGWIELGWGFGIGFQGGSLGGLTW